MTTPAISTRKLCKTYHVGSFGLKKVRALDGLDLEVQPGEIFGLLGPNGAGKSTTIKLLLNLIRPSSGSASLFGLPPSARAARNELGYLPENPAPYEYLTGRELVTLAAKLHGLAAPGLARAVDQVITQVEMISAQHLQIRRYSKGMIQRIALAQALVAQPRLLILDEPTSGLDVLGRQLIREVILDQRKRGTTIVFCSHIIPDVEALCDRVAVLIGGKLVKEGSVEQLLTQGTDVMEATIEGITLPALEAWAIPLVASQQLGERLLVKVSEQHTRDLLKRVLDAGGRLARLSPSRFSLEDLFIQTLGATARGTVGGDIS